MTRYQVARVKMGNNTRPVSDVGYPLQLDTLTPPPGWVVPGGSFWEPFAVLGEDLMYRRFLAKAT